jgi:hypothetical protein
MPRQTDIEATAIALVVGILLIAFAFTVLHFRNPQLEAQCIAKGGQVLSTPGRLSSCLYSNK